jgi:drug/metabolite transporter (DMT)-like permease
VSEIVATPTIAGTKQTRIWLALGALYLIWGSTYLAIRVALEAFPPLQLAGFRFVIAGGVLLGWQRLRGAPFPTLLQWRSGLIIGVLLIGGNTLVTAAEQWVSSGLSAVAIGSVPLWVGLLSGLFGRWPARNEWLALGVGFAGVMLLNLGGELRGQPLGAALLLLSALVWSLGSILSGRLAKASGLSGTGALMLCGGVLDLLIAWIIKEPRPHDVTFRAVFSFFWLVVAGSIVAFSTFTWLLSKVRPTLATSYAYVNPVVAVGLGALILNEPITGTSLVAMALILVGVGLLARAKTA